MNVLVCGAGGFIGGHLVKSLLDQGHTVKAVDIKPLNEWYQVFEDANNYGNADLRKKGNCYIPTIGIDRIYHLACNMGGMGFIAHNQSACIENSLITTNLMMACRDNKVSEIFYASSACVYPIDKQCLVKTSKAQELKESDCFPANPDDAYGWEKLFSELTIKYYAQDHNIDYRIARLHNVYGPHGSWQGGREKAPAAICRKFIEAKENKSNEIEIWGDGKQTRSFMYIDDCIKGINLMWEKGDQTPLNLGSDYMISIDDLVDMVSDISGLKLHKKYLKTAPQGVRGRNSDNSLIKEKLDWRPSITLEAGLKLTFDWIKSNFNV